MKKLTIKPIIKFNGGRGALLCNKCRVIIKEDLTKDELEGNTPLTHCTKCKPELYNTHKMRKIRLLKIEEKEDALVPNNIPVGTERFGYMQNPPVLGNFFLLFNGSGLPIFRTSLVKEIISSTENEKIFHIKTLNSVYQLEYLE